MKKKILIIVCAIGLIASSCLVKSLHPFYNESDVIFLESLCGTWLDQDSTEWHFKQDSASKQFMSPPEAQNNYMVKLKEDDDQFSHFKVHLFKIKSKYYLDFFPLIEQNIGDDWATNHFVPTHSIARLEIFGENNVAFFWYDNEWLKELFDERKVKISHEKLDNDDYVLTAKTAELQKFIYKYGENRDVFSKIDQGIYDFMGDVNQFHSLIEKEISKYTDGSERGGNDIIYSNMKKIK